MYDHEEDALGFTMDAEYLKELEEVRKTQHEELPLVRVSWWRSGMDCCLTLSWKKKPPGAYPYYARELELEWSWPRLAFRRNG